jgi:FKBP-type peptidyl-prolyl cis-trans isomerase SlyD
MDKVGKGSVVSLDYELHLGDGKVVDASTEEAPLAYIHGEGQLVPGLERALEGLSAGDARQVVISPQDGYGEHDPRGVQEVPRSAFPADFQLAPGMEIAAQGEGGETVPFVVREVKADSVVIDMNHPLAGRTLHFAVKVRGVRAATDEEKEHGHVHGPGGHGHDQE